MEYDKIIQAEAVFIVSILFIYIQLLCYCRYVTTISYLSHCFGAA